jgi:hypothetical protein
MRPTPPKLIGAMSVSHSLDEQRAKPLAATTPSVFELQQAGASLLPRFIKAEANLLRLPLFALQTKGLRSLDGIECRGKVTRNDTAYDFTLKASRNSTTLYPGPLARKAHLALLSVATEQGFPIQNPIAFGWRDLCRRVESSGSGRDIQHLKAALESTAGLLIKSHYALYSKPDNRMIRNQEDLLHLYERVTFIGSELPGGGTADMNYVWLASWYLDNLNALYTAPLDYELWRWLESRSPIASRLYEYLLFSFHSGTPVLRINYEKLAQLLPVRPEKYRSKAREQLEPALNLLEMVGVIKATEWVDSQHSIAQLHLHRGKLIAAPRDRGQLPHDFTEEEFAEAFEVRELRNPKPPEWSYVADFYRLWTGDESHQPTKKELDQAKAILEEYGPKKAKDVLLRVVKRMKKQFPDAKTFGAVKAYLPDAARDFDRDESLREQQQKEELRRKREREERTRQEAEEIKFFAAWRGVWEGLAEEQREAIRDAALSGSNQIFRRGPAQIAERLCLTELARRNGAPLPPTLVV